MASVLRRSIALSAIAALIAVDGVNGTLSSVNRAQVMGGFAATPDEAAWLNIGYVAAKLMAFALAPWLIARYGMKRTVSIGGWCLAAATAALAFAPALEAAVLVRVAQGLFGALVLVGGQTLVFRSYSATRQPLLQGTLALALVVVPVMLAPALHGWATDHADWRVVFVGGSLAAALAAGVFHLSQDADAVSVASPQAPAFGTMLLLASGIVGGVYVLQEGARFDWFDAGHIRLVAVLASIALVAASWLWVRRPATLRFLRSIGGNGDFVLGLCASFFAGFALFGSGAAIPLFGTVVLSLSPEYVGQLALTSSIAVAAGLLLAAAVLQSGRVPSLAPVPVGIVLFMAGMWLLSFSSAQTGEPQVRLATWLRGFGMGVLFVSLTMMTLGRLASGWMANGVALFNVGRQVGGLAGLAFVTTMLEWRMPAHAMVLSQYLQPGSAALESTQAAATSALAGTIDGASDAASASTALLARMVNQQSGARAFDEIFLGLALLFVVAIPVMVGIKRHLATRAPRRARTDVRAHEAPLSDPSEALA
ncbi:MFS transporter [Lysobacter sp. A6]|uniref:MFS transporter n=1 Tax=Noviluteimonas lactosilytica TaxID=2888523 RepID=A0ABS8JJH3_9GAMM|nr:MFS transporter [Lysobacter lactosilyticus]MCC8363749.1 MFS transporter [Lysobacter lactosilyticus]